MTPTQAAAAIRNSAGRFFTCVFVKADGSRREIDPPGPADSNCIDGKCEEVTL